MRWAEDWDIIQNYLRGSFQSGLRAVGEFFSSIIYSRHLLINIPRRLTPGDGYLEALVKDNVEPVYEEIDRIAPNGIHTADGQFYEVDVIVCATGFDMAWTPHFKLLGRNGLDIKDSWKPVPNCYLGVAAPGFPNYFVMNGPRSNLCNGTVLPCLETEIEYVIKAAKKMQSDRIKALDVSEDVTYKLNEHLEKWHSTSVWRDQCKSWYKNNTVDGKVMCWGGSVSHSLFLTRESCSNYAWIVFAFFEVYQVSSMGTLELHVYGR